MDKLKIRNKVGYFASPKVMAPTGTEVSCLSRRITSFIVEPVVRTSSTTRTPLLISVIFSFGFRANASCTFAILFSNESPVWDFVFFTLKMFSLSIFNGTASAIPLQISRL